MIALEHATKRYGRITALRDVSFEAEKGRITGLLGRNGAGKTTALNLLTGYFPPDEGRVLIRGTDMLEKPRECRRLIGYLPENNPLYEEMYVAEYLEFMAKMSNVKSQMTKELIELVGLTPEKHKHIRELSKGYRQRVGLAQALLGDPQLLILDEPTTGLDPNQLVEIRALIRDLGKERTVILSTHIMQEVREMCDRVVILDHGQIKADRLITEIEDLESLFRSATLNS